ncbi:ATP-binding cassette sub-family G member 8-like [Ostrea edulis]|uniref:ATP-binding cassette sub-family G member 8-like n=1 Tax=Ostrea edulis TaxID=37623 RepID=UPI002094752D|nr:ATP-binding cassette sub-family G member 8-like [Ostrea edulis]XP_048733667.1 ATP-binding cassette sub-family G member 8-like [Ostrea edulis]XP_048733668.1 ATP-binding cassette sub-family G member 8-like [Ostrea edulis]
MRSQSRAYPSVYYRPNEAVDMTQTSHGELHLGSPRIPTIDFGLNKRLSVDVRAENVSYIVNPKKMSLLHRLGALQLPWEWIDDAVPQQVLQNVSFSVKSGQMLAILGTSGSGKTSLLDVLAGRNDGGSVEGEMFLNGVSWTRQMVRSCSAYVRQDDRLLAHLTVKETLMFVAQLKLPSSFQKEEIENRVDGVISELGLRHVWDTKIGNEESRGVSGGERRRVSIGIQMLLDPSILFLDEPTSGLDSFTAHSLVETLSKMAQNTRTVLMSIHQPRSDIFELFDLVMILSRGRMVYVGRATEMVSYFTSIGHPCPSLTNPCDYYVDLGTVDPTSEETERETKQIVNKLINNFEMVMAPPEPEPEELSNLRFPVMSTLDITDFSPGKFRQFTVLFGRCTRNQIEDYLLVLAQFIQALSMSLVVGMIYLNLNKEQKTVRDWFGLMYIIGAMYPYLVILDLIAVYHGERKHLYYELQDGLYGTTPYFFAKVLSEFPLHTFFVVTYTIPVYFLVGFSLDVWVFFRVFALIYLMVYCSRSLAMLSSSIAPTFTMSCFIAQTFFSMYLMSAGFFINLDNIFEGLQWVSKISYLKWGFQGLCQTEISRMNFTCSLPDPRQCINTGSEALGLYSLNGSTVSDSCLVILASIAVYMVLYFLALTFIPQKPHQN